jgi:2OG-Fe(II) oxygenase superfamily
MITPEYNTVVLFKISPSSLHFVTPVSHTARDRRLAIVGFWERSQPTADGRPQAITLNGINLRLGLYGPPTDAVDERAVIL